MTARSITWAHIGDLHVDEADGWLGRDRLTAIVTEINAHLLDTVNFVFLPGDNADHGAPAQYRAIAEALAPLALPYRVIPGDHDFKPGDLHAYRAAFPAETRPDTEVVAGHRCLFLDIVSHGAGGPDFRLAAGQVEALLDELARAAAEGQMPLVFMHAYPGDLAADGETVARILAEGGVAFVDTGHTHYNELLNDGRVIYGATRSTAQVEEGGGAFGFSLVTIRDGVPSWRFKEAGKPWPLAQIVAPADIRLVTRPADPRQVPRPGPVEIVAKLFGHAGEPVTLSVDGGSPRAMERGGDPAIRRAFLRLDAGLYEVTVACGTDSDAIRLLVRSADELPRRRAATALGQAIHAVGSWPGRGITDDRLGPNANGRRW